MEKRRIEEMFPVGYYEFHENAAMNYQLNRFYSQGVFDYDELTGIAKQIDGFESWIKVFIDAGKQAEADKAYLKAATCYNAARFYALEGQADESGNDLKRTLYEDGRRMYDEYLKGDPEIMHIRIPFEDYQLPVYYVLADDPKGSVVVHSGYDGTAEEMLLLLPFFRRMGYNTYFFEGPGQGEVLIRYGIRMTTEWEKCTAAVLDHFNLDDVTLIGISLGGYLAPRAAAYEKRISRVVMYDLIYDFYGALLAKMGKKAKFFDYMVRHPKNILWKSLNKKLDDNYFTKWLLLQGYAIYNNVHTPCEYFNYIRRFNTKETSKLITQDVLVLAGEGDIYTVFYDEQIKALTNAKSVTGRLFTKEECADHHCQVGNMGLLLKTIIDWIEEKTNGQKTGADGRQKG